MISLPLYQLISTEDGIPSVAEYDCFKDGRIGARCRLRQKRLYILEAIAHNLHQLDSGVLPPDFPEKITNQPNSEILAGYEGWTFMDFKKFPKRTFTRDNAPRGPPACCIGFKMIFQKHNLIVGFLLDNTADGELDDKVSGDLDTSPHKSYLFAKVVDMFYQLISMTCSSFTVNSLLHINKFTPAEYKAIVFTPDTTSGYIFSTLDKYLTDYPIMITPNDACKYKYLVLDQIFKQAQDFIDAPPENGTHKYTWRACVFDMFIHIVTKWDLHLESTTCITLTLLAIAANQKYIAKLEARTTRKIVEAEAKMRETPEQKWIRSVESYLYMSDSSDNDEWK